MNETPARPLELALRLRWLGGGYMMVVVVTSWLRVAPVDRQNGHQQ